MMVSHYIFAEVRLSHSLALSLYSDISVLHLPLNMIKLELKKNKKCRKKMHKRRECCKLCMHFSASSVFPSYLDLHCFLSDLSHKWAVFAVQCSRFVGFAVFFLLFLRKMCYSVSKSDSITHRLSHSLSFCRGFFIFVAPSIPCRAASGLKDDICGFSSVALCHSLCWHAQTWRCCMWNCSWTKTKR